MKKYEAPEFDVTAYEVEDIITISVVNGNPIDSNEDGWVNINW